MAEPYWKTMSTIDCCNDCVPPKRHVGCHGTCEEYLDQKKRWEEDKKKIKENNSKNQRIMSCDFEKVTYANFKSRKK